MNISKGRPFPLGATVTSRGVNIAVVCEEGCETGRRRSPLTLVLERTDSGEKERIAFSEAARVGHVYYMQLEDLDTGKYIYSFEDSEGKKFTDPFAVRLEGTEQWGRFTPRGAYFPEEYDWGDDHPLNRGYSEMIMYLLHVRGFTKHISSGVKNKGTFEGVAEKVEYLKRLGINTVELMPAFEFNEVMDTEKRTQREAVNAASEEIEPRTKKSRKINYWGFTDGYLFAPKNAYSARGDGERSFKDMVKELHANGIGVVVQLYFEKKYDTDFISKCAVYWVSELHVDGLRILGEKIPKKALTENPYLKGTCIIFDEFEPEINGNEKQTLKNVAVLNDAFMCDNRKFLKGDADMLPAFVRHQLQNDVTLKRINYMDSYYGFTLNDMVTYDAKHNEDNGEGNTDGSDYNYSWNCGIEGKTRRKGIEALRLKQLRNAFTYLMLSQGVPEFVAGDEFRNSQKGNNNAYCQDNAVTYLNWNDLERSRELFEFVRTLIELRKEHKVFHNDNRLTLTDPKSLGAPDVSIHGEQAWAPRLDNYMRHIGIMYSGAYAQTKGSRSKDKDFYIAYNMHWQKHRFALPKPPKGKRWRILMNTESGFLNDRSKREDTELNVAERSIVMLEAV
ncbi:MAG: alpha-amylase [Lachnospiraceae bacterium]|nr:alpha-amylase [Lachnospiraceae bacterium]